MRSLWKKPFVDKRILQKFENLKMNKENKVPIEITCKSSVVFPCFVGMTFRTLNGKKFANFLVDETMVGHKLGEFVTTKKHPIRKKK